jgi:hypothetical protein
MSVRLYVRALHLRRLITIYMKFSRESQRYKLSVEYNLFYLGSIYPLPYIKLKYNFTLISGKRLLVPEV